MVCVSIDVTDLKVRTTFEIEKTQLLANEHAANEANQLKSQFLANMSHELRTPIAEVLGMVDLLIETPLLAEQLEYARSVPQSADSLLSIVNDGLDFSKIEAGRFEIEEITFDLSGLLGGLVSLMLHAASRKALELSYSTDVQANELVQGDPGRVRQILLNLCTNAIKFTSKGSVSLSVVSQQILGGAGYCFIFQDTGIGIDEKTFVKLFRPFSQADPSTSRQFGVTGLGLTICRELATLMRGSIVLESEPKKGTRATFTVPFKTPPSKRNSIINPVSSASPPVDTVTTKRDLSLEVDQRPLLRHSPSSNDRFEDGNEIQEVSKGIRARTHVLIVEDNAINQTIATKLVRKLGFPVNAVWNGKEALDYLSHPTVNTPRPDIVLMDCQMPILDGYQATQELRKVTALDERVRDVPVVRSCQY